MPSYASRTERGQAARRRVRRLLFPLGLGLVLFGALVWPGLAYNFGNLFRLSTNLPVKAFNPDIASAGERVAVVWSEGFNTQSDTKHWGHIYLKSASASGGWDGRTRVFTATQNAWAREPRLAFDPGSGNRVHLAWAQASACGGVACQWSTIRRTVCYLGGADRCDPPTTVVTGRLNVASPDIVVDGNGVAHIVWREGPGEGAGSIRYCRNTCSGAPSSVTGAGQHPSLAYANGYLHLVWDTGPQTNSTIKYAREDNLGNSTWDASPSRTWWNGSHPLYQEPGYPSVGARGGAVYAVWAVQSRSDTARYSLAFDYSADQGDSWTDTDPNHFGRGIPGNEWASFTSHWFSVGQPASELYSLQPEVVVTGTAGSAYAHLVWHGKQVIQGKYKVWYSFLRGYSDTRDWAPPTEVLADGAVDRALPGMAIGRALSETHVALVMDAGASSFAAIDVWYVGAYGNRQDDPDDFGGIYLPVIGRNHP